RSHHRHTAGAGRLSLPPCVALVGRHCEHLLEPHGLLPQPVPPGRLEAREFHGRRRGADDRPDACTERAPLPRSNEARLCPAIEGGIDGPLPFARAHGPVLGSVSHATRHTRQRAVGSVRGSPCTRKKSAGPPSKIRPASGSSRSSPPRTVAEARASQGSSPASTSDSTPPSMPTRAPARKPEWAVTKAPRLWACSTTARTSSADHGASSFFGPSR